MHTQKFYKNSILVNKTQNSKLQNRHVKKFSVKKWWKMEFLIFFTMCKSVWPLTFLVLLHMKFFVNGFEISILRFIIPILNFLNKIDLLSSTVTLKLSSKILGFHFTSLFGLEASISSKKVIVVKPYLFYIS